MKKSEQVEDLKFLKKIVTYGGVKLYRLIDTDYLFAIRDYSSNSIVWKKAKLNKPIECNVTFSEVFDNVPVEVQEDLAFHFDIFKE